MNRKQLRAQGYVLLSQMLQRPDEKLLGLVGNSEFQAFWRQAEDTYHIRFPASWEINALPDLKEWDHMWNVTMGPAKPLAEPIESLHKPWTTDPSCEITIATQKGWLKSDWACHMEELLTGSGFVIPPQFSHCPDHLILELEFASVLVEEAPVETLIKFAEHHFDWLTDLLETAQEKNAPKIYEDLYDLCLQYVKADMQAL